MRCTIVAQSNVDFIWSSVEHFIQSAFTKHESDDTPGTALDLLRTGGAQLWIAHDGRGIRAALITRLATTNSGRRICFSVACGGIDFDEWEHCLREVEKFAKANTCDAVRITGRRGWRAKLRPNYKETFVTLEKAL